MIVNFNTQLVLTTQNPQAFLTFQWEAGDASIWLIPDRISDVISDQLKVNGIDISQDASIYSTDLDYAIYISEGENPGIASFLISTSWIEDFDTAITIRGYDSPALDNEIEVWDVSIYNRPFLIEGGAGDPLPSGVVQSEGDASYMLLRTNPKFSGNVKIIISNDNKIYLDTFKVSPILSNRKFRKQSVSGSSFLSGDIRRIFASLPLGEMYRLDEEETLNIKIPKTDLADQYSWNYSYGARFLLDDLYPEPFSILAPLWLNNKVPDYFILFRLPGVFNPETYSSSPTDYISKYLSEGELIKSWPLKEASPLGTYMRNHLREIQANVAPVFLSLSDPDQRDPDPNTWYGVSVNSGIITGKSETTFNFDRKSSNFTDLNDFISLGFERKNNYLLCGNLVNLEFAFEDEEPELFKMNRYFGLYAIENPLYQVFYYADDPSASVQVIPLDGKDPDEFFSSSLFDASGLLQSKYSNRIFTLDDRDGAKRFSRVEEIDGTILDLIEPWVSKVGDQIFSAEVEKKEFDSFITFHLETNLIQGEHLRVLSPDGLKIWEVYGSDTHLLEAGESWQYATKNDLDWVSLHQVIFSTRGEKEDQERAILSALRVFSNHEDLEWSASFCGKGIAIFSEAPGYRFQRLTAQTPPAGIPNGPFNSAAGPSDIVFYGEVHLDESDFERIEYDSSYGPIGLEIFGDRLSVSINFADVSSYQIYSIENRFIDEIEDLMLYQAEDGWRRLVERIDVSTLIDRSPIWSSDPETEEERIIIITKAPISLVRGFWNAFRPYPITISLMGILPVNDFDFTVYDASLGFKSEYWYKREGDASTYFLQIPSGEEKEIDLRGSYEILSGSGVITISASEAYFVSDPSDPFRFNTFQGGATIAAASDTLVTFGQLDGSASFISYRDGVSEENIWEWFDSSSMLRFPLKTPYITKWEGLGIDCRGNPLRLILSDSSLLEASTNFIPTETEFSDEISFPVYKYLSPGEDNWGDYVFYDPNDTAVFTEDGSIKRRTLKEMMFQYPYSDLFSKIVYSANEVSEIKNRSTNVYYNNFKGSVDFIISGLSLSLKPNSSARALLDIKDWDRFRISLISTASRNRNSNSNMEVIVNENTKTILIIWYQGGEVLNYNMRNSSTIPGWGVLDGSLASHEFQSYTGGDPDRSGAKMPFVLNTNLVIPISSNIYGEDASYGTGISSPYVQLNSSKISTQTSIFNAYGTNQVIFPNVFSFPEGSYDTFTGIIRYLYLGSPTTFGPNVVNASWNYLSNENLYRGETTSFSSFSRSISRNEIDYYIIRRDSLLTEATFQGKPLFMSITNPRAYRGISTYNGWYRPKFNPIFKFDSNEDTEIISTFGKDFILANTNPTGYSGISQLWFSKVVEAVTQEDIDRGMAIDWRSNWDPFSSLWDNDYFYLYQGISRTAIPGYRSGKERPSFFGSKLARMPKEILLDSWGSTTARVFVGPDYLEFEYNLTRRLLEIFRSNSVFLSNWEGLSVANEFIDSYINETVQEYYKIDINKIRTGIWTRTYSGEYGEGNLSFQKEADFQEFLPKNITASLNYRDGNYIYNIRIGLIPNRTYFFEFTLFEK